MGWWVGLFVSLSHSVSFFVSVCLVVCLSEWVSVSVCLSVYLSVCLSVSLSLSLSLSLPLLGIRIWQVYPLLLTWYWCELSVIAPIRTVSINHEKSPLMKRNQDFIVKFMCLGLQHSDQAVENSIQLSTSTQLLPSRCTYNHCSCSQGMRKNPVCYVHQKWLYQCLGPLAFIINLALSAFASPPLATSTRLWSLYLVACLFVSQYYSSTLAY